MPSAQAAGGEGKDLRGKGPGGADRAFHYSLAAPSRSPVLAPPRSPTPSPGRIRPRARSPNPTQKQPATTPASNLASASSLPTGIPSWVTAWSRPTVSSSQLHDGPQLKDFVARPLPPTSASRTRRGRNMDTGGPTTTTTSQLAGSGGRLGGSFTRSASIGRSSGSAQTADGTEPPPSGGGSVLMHFMRANSVGIGQGPGAATTASSAPLLFRSMAGARSAWTPAAATDGTAAGRKFSGGAWAWVVAPPAGGSGGGGRPAAAGLKRISSMRPSAASATGSGNGSGSGGGGVGGGAQPRQRPLSAGPLRGKPPPAAEASAAAAVDAPATPGSLSALLLQRSASRNAAANRPASAGGNGTQRSSVAAATTGAAAFAAVTGRARSPALVAGFDPEPQRRRGPGTMLQLNGLGPAETDLGHLVDASDLLLAGGPAGTVPTVVAERPPNAGSGAAAAAIIADLGFGDEEEDEGPASPTMQLVHMPLPQHVLLSGSLQDLYERIGRSGDRPIHFSLGAVAFSGELDPALNDVIRIQNRIVILHNCTLLLRPGQQFWVGDGGHLILADVNVYATTAAAAAGTAGGAAGGGGAQQQQGSGERARSGGSKVTWASPPAQSPRRPEGGQSRWAYGGDTHSGKGSGRCVPLLQVVTGGRMLLRGCRVKILSPGEPIPGAPTSTGGPPLSGPQPPSAQAPRSPRTTYTRSAVAAATAVGGGPATPRNAPNSPPGAGGSVPVSSLVCVVAEGGGIVEAVGCRLGRCVASGRDTSLTLRRCRLKPGSACARDAPLLSASDGVLLSVSATEVRDGPALGLSLSGPADTRVELAQSAITNCGSHGVMAMPGVELLANACRICGNGAGGLAARGRGAVAELADCELSANAASNVWVSNGGAVRLTACAALSSVEGCGLNTEGRGSRVVAEGCAFDANGACGVRVRHNAELDLRDCSASGNGLHGVDVEGTFDAADGAERLAEATLAAEIPPPPPLPDIFVIIAGGQLAKNGRHGCCVTGGGGLRVTGSEISQNGEDGAYADGPGCELLVDSCRIVRNCDNGVFVCSGAAVWVDGCRLGGNLLGHVAVGGRGSRGRLTRCTFEYSPVTALRVQMGAKVALRDCDMESQPAAAAYGAHKAPPLTRTFYNVDELRKRRSSGDSEGGDIVDGPQPWAVGTIRSKYVKLMGQGSLLSIDGRAIFATIGDDGRPLGS